jgi:sugar/nucleoside kinase (ribokinase family)
MLFNAAAQERWEVPAYPARLADLTGAGDAFAGGFLAGYNRDYDPLRAVLHGNVSSSLTIEGSGAFHALEALPGLAQARLESLSTIVRRV